MKTRETRWSMRSQFAYVSRLYSWYTENALQELGYPISYSKVVGNLINFNGLNQRELAQECFMAPTSLTNVLRKMEEDELILRKKGGWKGETLIFLTEKGVKLHESAFDKLLEVNKTMTSGLTAEEQQSFQNIIFKISENLKQDSLGRGKTFYPHIQIRKIDEKFVVEDRRKKH